MSKSNACSFQHTCMLEMMKEDFSLVKTNLPWVALILYHSAATIQMWLVLETRNLIK